MTRRNLMVCGVLLGAWLSATGAIGTCAFFQPAAPEIPNKPPIPTDYTVPTQTLLTMARGMVDKTGNGQNVYLSAFADSSALSVGDGRAYHAFFDPRDLSTFTGDPNWDKELEPFVFNSLVQKYPQPFEMTWEPYQPAGNEFGGADDSLLHRKYKIVQLTRSGSTITRVPLAIGAADLQFVRSVRDPSKWVIAIWQDSHTVDADSSQVTLGQRRLETR